MPKKYTNLKSVILNREGQNHNIRLENGDEIYINGDIDVRGYNKINVDSIPIVKDETPYDKIVTKIMKNVNSLKFKKNELGYLAFKLNEITADNDISLKIHNIINRLGGEELEVEIKELSGIFKRVKEKLNNKDNEENENKNIDNDNNINNINNEEDKPNALIKRENYLNEELKQNRENDFLIEKEKKLLLNKSIQNVVEMKEEISQADLRSPIVFKQEFSEESSDSNKDEEVESLFEEIKAEIEENLKENKLTLTMLANNLINSQNTPLFTKLNDYFNVRFNKQTIDSLKKKYNDLQKEKVMKETKKVEKRIIFNEKYIEGLLEINRKEGNSAVNDKLKIDFKDNWNKYLKEYIDYKKEHNIEFSNKK